MGAYLGNAMCARTAVAMVTTMTEEIDDTVEELLVDKIDTKHK